MIVILNTCIIYIYIYIYYILYIVYYIYIIYIIYTQVYLHLNLCMCVCYITVLAHDFNSVITLARCELRVCTINNNHCSIRRKHYCYYCIQLVRLFNGVRCAVRYNHAHIHTHTYIRTNTHIYTSTSTHTNSHTHTHLHTHIHTRVLNLDYRAYMTYI